MSSLKQQTLQSFFGKHVEKAAAIIEEAAIASVKEDLMADEDAQRAEGNACPVAAAADQSRTAVDPAGSSVSMSPFCSVIRASFDEWLLHQIEDTKSFSRPRNTHISSFLGWDGVEREAVSFLSTLGMDVKCLYVYYLLRFNSLCYLSLQASMGSGPTCRRTCIIT